MFLIHNFKRVAGIFLGLALAGPFAAGGAGAQAVDIIRGRIIGPDSAAVDGATVTAASMSGNVTRSARTDKTGRYTISFPGDDGDYWINVAALGFAGKRFELKRVADEAILIADARLTRPATQLATVQIKAPRQRVSRNDTLPDVGGSERPVDVSNLTADQLGAFAAMAASLPGVQFIPGNGGPDGFSVFGLGPDQNVTSLNGLLTDATNLPRDAAINSSLMTSPYDVSIGGFSGGRLNVRSKPGSNFVTRTGSATLDAPSVQWTDRAGRALGQQYNNVSVGGVASGPMTLNESFYNISYQLGHRTSNIEDLLNAGTVGLNAAGIAPDSVTRLLSLLSRAQVPTTAGRIPRQQDSDQGLVFGALDFNPSLSTTGQTLNLTFNGGWNHQTPASSTVTELPSHGADRTSWNGSFQARHTRFYGSLYSETSAGVSETRSFVDPYLALPNANVRIASTLDDGSESVSTLDFGGTPNANAGSTSTALQLVNQLSWFSENNKHRLKLATEARRESASRDLTSDALGTFAFNSLEDLANGEPASFSRTLLPRTTQATQFVGALSLGDFYRPSSDVQLQYGLRLDGNQFSGGPEENSEIVKTFGVDNARLPRGVSASPRLGFSWAYGSADEVTSFTGAARAPRSVIRGGIGLFQGTPSTASVTGALSNTGLAGAAQQLLCVGSAVPTPDWAEYAHDRSTIPSACADGTSGTPFASSAPNVIFFDKSFASPRSLRSNLQWTGGVGGGRFVSTVEGTYSLNIDQPGTVDLNFSSVPRFTLGDEGNRPVFANASSIVPATGAIAAGGARQSDDFSHVTEFRSGLRGESRQISIRLQPARANTSYSWTVAYVYQNIRDQSYGFSNTAGDPRLIDGGRANFDSRHQIVYSLGYNAGDWVRLNWFGQVRSGSPYTPFVAGDVNGDGAANDRAFIFDPAHTADSALANDMRRLLAGAPGSARDCLHAQLGTIAGRNSCEGPWTAYANVSAGLNPVKMRLPQRASLTFQLSNPLSAVDLALHGEDHLHHWGQPALPSSQLLYVSGFDPGARRFIYDVNPRFGAPQAAQSAFLVPIALTAVMKVDLGPTRERQSLIQLLDRGRTTNEPPATEALLRALYVGGGLVNPLAAILRQPDTLGLTSVQADSLAVLNQLYSLRLDSLWAPIMKELAALPKQYDAGAAYARYRSGREQSVDLLLVYVPLVSDLLSREERKKLPVLLTSYLDPRYLRSIRSGTAGFGALSGAGGAPIGSGGGVVSAGR